MSKLTNLSFTHFCLLGALLMSGSLSAQSWIEYTSQEDFFNINFPGQPGISEISYPSEYGAVFPGRVYSSSIGDRSYTVTVIDYTDSENIHQSRSNTTEADSLASYIYWQIDVVASVAYAATQFRNRGSTVDYDAWHHIERVPGHQLNLTNPDGSRSYIGIYLHEARLYIVEATAPRGTPPQLQFQQSLGFIDEDGMRIRYNWNDKGHLIREENPNP
ncbi:MAG: hypothetical protein HOL48_06310 [Porticoccaceae bacterium]|jgi:YD repeat-containing protein|nr:hypothetical protein [Porticoccaceae bacterium]